ncbi:MAG: hypothetical protein HY308_07910 [Gammaproteobacteria bacterium]|nr:hypothetical protein [Gammaproteobacteria bacterium]
MRRQPRVVVGILEDLVGGRVDPGALLDCESYRFADFGRTLSTRCLWRRRIGPRRRTLPVAKALLPG